MGWTIYDEDMPKTKEEADAMLERFVAEKVAEGYVEADIRRLLALFEAA
jgi:hypothetical protein